MKKVKILVGFIMDGKAGGIDKYLLNFLEQVHNECVQVDFLTNHIDANLKQKLEQYDSHLYEVANLKQPNLQYRQICDIIQKNKYDVTYFNISTAISRIGPQAAFDCNVPIRVIHSHSTGNDCSNPYKRKLLDFLHNKYKKQLYKTANRFYACSKKAGLWMFPESIVESDKFKVIHNAVDTKKFAYNINTRQQMRKNLGVEDNFVIGHVGNFCYPKNYPFILDVVEAASKQNPKIRLLLAGTGPDFEHVQNLVKDKNLQNKVIFLGQRSDIHDIMQAMDVFLFPSRFEGLGIVLIEAQASGLPCVTSTAVPYEAAVTKSTIFLSLDDTIQKWVDTVCGFETYERVDKTDEISAAGYDLAGEKEAYMSIIT